MNKQILTAVFSEEIKDEIIDTMMSLEVVSGFTLGAVHGYSREHSRYDIKEQVAGHRRMCRIEVMHGEDQEQVLLAALQDAGKASHVRYWISPVSGSGVIPDSGEPH
ncbi:DUF3240 domain-containing protein [Pseudohalioglobus sediminis]|uniref:DUF3240 domain-containing protein n=1 Tax=Pseudohalioglobus sediminis TaxID=2606449 RepID=A0A5B0X2Y4_9GAMM|nr:DUF3240 family protein [Pseudohalioglobus sediminis]KAA1193065.1 DUF3240 domain-containing protein [Pseudohalioglobus sediminis]